MLNRFYVVLTSFLLVVLFQNCSGVGFNHVGTKADAFGNNDLSFVIPTDPSMPDDPGMDVDESEADGHTGGNAENDTSNPPGSSYEPDPSHESDSPLERELRKNPACQAIFDGIDSTAFPETAQAKFSGIHGDVVVANAKELIVTGIVKSVAAVNVGTARISGIYGALCLMADDIAGISGIQNSPRADVAIIGPEDRLGTADHIVGVQNSYLVIKNFHVKKISGVGKALHIFGGKVDKLTGIFSEIHLHEGAELVKRNGINKVIVHP